MYLYEYQAKELLKKAGIPTPDSELVTSPDEAFEAATRIGKSAVKAQVKAGGRGKAGLIKLADSAAQAKEATQNIFGAVHEGEEVKQILVEQQIDIAKELYVSVVLDTLKGVPVVLVSSEGGVNIEEVAETHPEAIKKMDLDPLETALSDHMWVEMWSKVGLKGKQLLSASAITSKMVKLFYEKDAMTVEINPLVVTSEGKVMAADGKFIVDESSLYRHKEFDAYQDDLSGTLEKEASENGVTYVSLNSDGYIGIIAGGAGLSMATMDAVVESGGIPAAFLDLGGGISVDGMAESLRIMLKTEGLKGIVINVFGGINNCEIMAKGIQKVYEEKVPKIPVVVKMRGHSQDEGWEILEGLKIPLIKHGTTDETLRLLMGLVPSSGRVN